MKKTYEERGLKFAETLAKMFQSCVYIWDFVAVIEEYNATHSRKLQWSNGVSRIVIMRSDYVIKFDYHPTGWWEDGHAGNCETEEEVYAMAEAEGMEHLLAKPTVRHLFGHTVSVMPRIKNVHNSDRWWGNYCTEKEFNWLEDNIRDLHDGNLGYRGRKVCIVDYAFIDAF